MPQLHPSTISQENHPAFRIDSNQVTPDALALKLRITQAQAARFLKGQNLAPATWAQVRAKLEFGIHIPVVYSVQEVSCMAGVSPSTVQRWIADKRLQTVPYLTPRRIPATALALFLGTALHKVPLNPTS